MKRLGKKIDNKYPNVETVVMENIPEGADSARVFTQLAEQGCELVVAASFGYMDAVLDVAEKYPEVKFLHITGTQITDNVTPYFGKMYQLRYLSGIIAGMVTKTDLIGYTAAFPIPACIRGLNAFTLGVRSVNPDAIVKVVWTNTWYDPAVEKEAANSLLDAGADIISMHQDSPAGLQAAAERGAYGIGYDNDMSSFAPEATLTSLTWDWTKFYEPEIQAIIDGSWESQFYWGGLEVEGLLQLAPYGDMVPEEAKKLVEEKKALMAAQEWDVYTGPIKDQDGEIRVKDGEQLTDEEVYGMNWLVEGVDGQLPD
jgi:basic membrane protein A